MQYIYSIQIDSVTSKDDYFRMKNVVRNLRRCNVCTFIRPPFKQKSCTQIVLIHNVTAYVTAFNHPSYLCKCNGHNINCTFVIIINYMPNVTFSPELEHSLTSIPIFRTTRITSLQTSPLYFTLPYPMQRRREKMIVDNQ